MAGQIELVDEDKGRMLWCNGFFGRREMGSCSYGLLCSEEAKGRRMVVSDV